MVKDKCAVLVIDCQNYFAVPGRGFFKHVDSTNIGVEHRYYFNNIEKRMIPCLSAVLSNCHARDVQVVHTYVECLTKDCRDQSLDYKITGFEVPKGNVVMTLNKLINVKYEQIFT